MNQTPEQTKRESQRALWILILAMAGMLVASAIGLMLVHGFPGVR